MKPESSSTCPDLPDEVLEQILALIDSGKDRNSASLVSKNWYEAERWTRSKLFVTNLFPVCPQVARRFPRITRVELHGRHGYSDFPKSSWDGSNNLYPWLVMFAKVYPFLEELTVDSMTVNDDSLELLAESFPSLKALSLTSCDGFSFKGIKMIDRHCNDRFIIFSSDYHPLGSIFGFEMRRFEFELFVRWPDMTLHENNAAHDRASTIFRRWKDEFARPKSKPKDPKAELQKAQLVEMRRRERKLSKSINIRVQKQNSKKAMVRGGCGRSRGR